MFYQSSGSGTFSSFERRWRLRMSSTTNSAFEMTGAVQEQGRVGAGWSNTGASTVSVAAAGAVTFRNRFAATPSSITFMTNYNTGDSTAPSVISSTRDGFGYYGYRSLNAGQWAFWVGTYTATA